MRKNNLDKLSILSNDELLLIEGGGLSELTSRLVHGAAYAAGWFWSRSNARPAHGSALLGPSARPIM